MNRLFALLLTLWVAPSLAAQSPAPAAGASARSIRAVIEITKPQRMLDVALGQVENSINTSMKAGLGEQQPTPEQQAIIDQYKTQLLALLREQLNWANFEPDVIDAYASTFSQSEIDAMLAFYRTPAGQAMIEKMPALTQAMMAKMQDRMRDLVPKLQQISREMVAKLKETAAKTDSPKP